MIIILQSSILVYWDTITATEIYNAFVTIQENGRGHCPIVQVNFGSAFVIEKFQEHTEGNSEEILFAFYLHSLKTLDCGNQCSAYTHGSFLSHFC